ncbi:MAG: hypothetical protein R2750_04925 [Bacteroidales bacterium]
MENIIHTGGGYFAGCYNKDRSKLFFLQGSQYTENETDQENYNSHVAAYDIEMNETQIIELGSKLTDIEFNEDNNKILISSFGNNSLFIINANDYSDIVELPGIVKPYSIESGSGDIAYIGGYNQVYFVDMSNNTVYNPFAITGGDRIYDLAIDNELHRLYVGGGYNVTTVDVQDVNTPLIINVANISFSKHYMQIVKTDQGVNNIIMVAGTDYFIILNANTFEYVIPSNDVNKICYGFYERKIYTIDAGTAELNVFNINGDFINDLQIPHETTDIEFNPNNNSIYVAGLNNEKLAISSVECRTEEVSGTILLNENSASSSLMAGTINNKVVNVNGYLSNASLIQAYTDNRQLNFGWNWLSFPRMQRFENEPDRTETVLSRISVFPVNLHIEFDDASPELKTKDYNLFGGWSGDLDELQSTSGYKLRLELLDGYPPNIDLFGAALDPETETTIYSDQYPGQGIENWKGYFIEYPQKVEACIPPEVMEDLNQ